MNTDLQSVNLRAGPQQVATVRPLLLARGSADRLDCHPWQLYQRGGSVYLRSRNGWVELVPVAPARAIGKHGKDAAEGAALAGAAKNVPAEDMLCSVHTICAHPGKGEWCTSDSLPLGFGQRILWSDMDSAVTDLARRFEVEQLVLSDNRLHALVRTSKYGASCEYRIFAEFPRGRERWEELAPPEEAVTGGRRISHIMNFNDTLYITVDDEISGFQLWRMDGPEEAEGGWSRVIDSGCEGHALNARVTAVYADEEQLLLACAPGSEQARFDQHAQGPELILVRPDNNWDLIVGTTRPTPRGLAVPRSLMGRGFDQPAARQITSITRCGSTFFASVGLAADADKQLRGEVWCSEDLCSWSSVALPDELRVEDATLVLALRNATNMLLVIKRQPDAGDLAEYRSTPAQSAPGLQRDIEFWLVDGRA